MIDLPDSPNTSYNEMQAKDAACGQLVSSGVRTVGQNIQDRIARHKDAISKLEAVYNTLQTGTILDVNLNDLQQAMRW